MVLKVIFYFIYGFHMHYEIYIRYKYKVIDIHNFIVYDCLWLFIVYLLDFLTWSRW